MTTSATSQSATAFLSRFRPPASLLTTRARPNGWMKTSSLALLTSIPRYTCVLTLCCDGALPCMRDSLPIICSGQASKGGRILLTHGSKPEGPRSRPPDRLGAATPRRSSQALSRFGMKGIMQEGLQTEIGKVDCIVDVPQRFHCHRHSSPRSEEFQVRPDAAGDP